MTKVDIRRLDSVTTNDTTATQLINENFTALQEAIENTISRDGTTPNFMDADLDLNSYKIINAGTPTNNTDVITKEYFDQNVGDAAGYAAAAASSAQQASMFAGSASSYASVATSAADIAQAAKDFIQNDPGFQTVVADLQLGVNGSMYKVNANKVNIDTVAGSITNVNKVGNDIANVNSVAGDLTNINSVVTNMTDINNVADDLTKITAVADDLTNIDNVADDLTNIDNVADDLTNINAVADNATNINAVANNETNIKAVNANKTNIDAVAGNNSNITAVAGNAANINAVNANKTNIDAVAANNTDISSVAGDLTNINSVAADLTNIDAASGYAAEAKQWAIGEPTEPTGGSAKYWAGQAAAGQVQADWAEADTSSKAYIRNKPTVDSSPTQNSTNLVQSGGVYSGLDNLQSQIDTILLSSDVYDVVGTYTDLQNYDISTVPVNDIIKVLSDSTHSDAASYYRCTESGGVKSWTYVGSEGPYYTKSESNTLLNAKANTDLSNLSATGQAVLDAKQDVATAVNYDNITNCITEIPQDIKLELNNGTLTLKAGSKVYVPNGAGVFDTITTENDITRTGFAYSGQFFLGLKIGGTGFEIQRISDCASGTNPTGHTGWYYKTDDNTIKRYSNGTPTADSYSLPIGIFSADGTNILSIDQVFNGFGYIGSTVFALPGVKGLIPNGRNADGSLKNIEFTLNGVKTWNTVSANLHSKILYDLSTDNLLCPNDSTFLTRRIYSEKENIWTLDGTRENYCELGSFVADSVSPYKITSLTPKTAFHAVDYNDFKQADNNNVKLTGNQTIGDIKTFNDSMFTKNIIPKGLITLGTSTNTWGHMIQFQDTAGKRIARVQPMAYSTAINRIGMWVNNADNTAEYGIEIWSNGATSAPTPATSDNSSKIATTAYVNNKFQVVSALPASPDSSTFYFITA